MRTLAGTDYYKALKITPDAEPELVVAAYRVHMRRCHPDTSDMPVGLATEMSKTINEAFRVIGDPAKRAAYDASLRPRLTATHAPWYPHAPHSFATGAQPPWQMRAMRPGPLLRAERFPLAAPPPPAAAFRAIGHFLFLIIGTWWVPFLLAAYIFQ